MKTYLKVFHILRKGTGILLLLILVLLLLLRLPAVQTKLARMLANRLSEQTQSRIEIDKVAVNFMDEVCLKGIYIETPEGDTLLYSRQLEVDIAIPQLLKRRLLIDKVSMEGAVVRIVEEKRGRFNFQYLVDRFTPDNSREKPDKKPFTTDIREVLLNDLSASFDLLQGKNHAHFGSLRIKMNQLDLINNHFDVEHILIDQLNGSSTWEKPLVKKPAGEKHPINGFPLNGMPLNIQCDKLAITNSNVIYQQGEELPGMAFTPGYLHGEGIDIEILGIRVDSSQAKADIRQIGLVLNETVRLESFRTDAVFASEGASAGALFFQLNESRGSMTASVSYEAFRDLVTLSQAAKVDLQADSLALSMTDIAYFLPQIKSIPELLPYRNETIHLAANARGSLGEVQIGSFRLDMADHSLLLKGTFSDFADPDRLTAQNGSLSVSTNVRALRPIIGQPLADPAFNRFGNIRLRSAFSGSLDALKLARLSVETDGLLRFDLSGKVNHLRSMDRLAYDVGFRNIRTGYTDVLALTDSLPQLLTQLDTLYYSGTVKGTVTDYDLNGVFLTNLGTIETAVVLKFNEHFNDAAYNGEISLVDFDLGKLLTMDSLGRASLNTTINGEGLTLDSLDAFVNMHLQSLDYNSYSYEHIALNGRFERKRFTGDVISRDENLSFDFEGMIDINDSIPEFQLTSVIETLKLQALNLSSEPFDIAGKINADIRGLDPDEMEGLLYFNDVELTRNKKYWAADSISFLARHALDDSRQIDLFSPFATGSMSGKFRFDEMGRMARQIMDKYFPIPESFADSIFYSGPLASTHQQDHHLTLDLKLTDPVKIADMFNIKLARLDSADLHLSIDESADQVGLSLNVPHVEYSGMAVDSIELRIGNINEALQFNLRTGTYIPSANFQFPSITGSAIMKDRRAQVQIIVENDTGGHQLELHTDLVSRDNEIEIGLADPLVINAKSWQIESEGPLTLARKALFMPYLTLQSGEQAMRIGADEKLMSVDLLNFNLNNVTDFVKINQVELGGSMYGHLDIGLKKDIPILAGDLEIQTIYIGDRSIGDLSLLADVDGNDVKAIARLSGNNNDIKVNAGYRMDSREVDGTILINKLSVEPFQAFYSKYATEITGAITGNLSISGTTEKPEVDGTLTFDNVSAFVQAAQTRYSIGSGSIGIGLTKITPDLILNDETGREATLKGLITHNSFSDLGFNLKFSSDEFTFLNMKKTTDGLYYGRFIAKINAAITGDIKVPKVVATVAAIEGTDMSVQLLSKKAVINKEDYMIFYDGTKQYSLEQLDSIAVARYKIKSQLDLTINASIRETSLFRLIIDPITGDNLEVRGDADLVIRLPKNGDLSITGVYTVQEGNYRFSYQKLLKRNFSIVTGSRINFIGDPMNARLNIQAAYRTEASTAALVSNEISSFSDSERSNIKGKSDVEVLLNITGALASPELKFDIQLKDDNQSPVGSSAERALASIRQNDSELNKQVFSLLLFNSFTASLGGGSFSGAGTSTAIRSVGDMINNQLSKLTSQAKGFGIDFDIDQYANALSETGGDITEIDMGISQSLINDRLVISIGGNINLESGNPDQQAFSNIAGDFMLEYKISQGGKYRVNIFQRTDYDALNQDNLWKTGVGFSYQTKFNRLRNKIKKNKKPGNND